MSSFLFSLPLSHNSKINAKTEGQGGEEYPSEAMITRTAKPITGHLMSTYYVLWTVLSTLHMLCPRLVSQETQKQRLMCKPFIKDKFPGEMGKDVRKQDKKRKGSKQRCDLRQNC